jgi:hypothetical protein
VANDFADNRRSELGSAEEIVEFDPAAYIVKENTNVVVTKEEEEHVEPPPTQAVGMHNVPPTLTIEEDVETLESSSSSSDSSDAEELRELQKKYRVLKKAYEVLLKSTLAEGSYQSVQLLLNLL